MLTEKGGWHDRYCDEQRQADWHTGDEGRVYISEKAYKRIKTEGFKDKEVFVLMGHTESSGGRYATFVEAAIAVYDMEFE